MSKNLINRYIWLIDTIYQAGSAGIRSRFLRVDEPHLHTLAEHLRQQPEERLLGFPLQYIQVFDVGGTNPQRVLGLHREVKHGGVVGGVGDKLEHSKLRNENFT